MVALDPDRAKAMVERLSHQLSERRPTVDTRLDYLRGRTGRLKFATEEFANYHGNRYAGFSDNWCAPVIQAPQERMNLQGIRLGDSRKADFELMRAWDISDCERGASEAFAVFMGSGWAYALVHPGRSEGEIPRVTWEHPSAAIVDRDPIYGDERIGMVSWIDDDFDYSTLYTDEEVWRFRRSRTPDRWDSKLPSQGGGWELREDVDNPQRNPLGLMPLVEFRNETLLDDVPVSDIGGVICMQDAINLTWAYLLNALDYASLPGRVVLGTAPPEIPILDQSGQPTGKTRPLPLDEFIRDRIAFIPGENISIGEWSVATLDGFSKVIEQAVEHIAAQTRTPPHYLVARMVNTAAESLTIAEAGLVSKTRERIRMAKAPLRRIFRLMALAMGDEAKAEQCQTATLLWSQIQYRSEAQLADALSKKRQIGYPVQYLLELDGLDPDEVQRVMSMLEDEQRDPLAERLLGGGDDGGTGASSPAPEPSATPSG